MDQNDLDRTLEALKVCGRLEAALAELYQICAEAWPESDAFWNSLSKAEWRHVAYVKELAELIVAEPDRFVPQVGVTAAAAREQVDYVNARAREYKSKAVSERTALLAVREMESGLLESRFHEIVTTDSPEYAAIAAMIVGDTQQHWETVNDRLQEPARTSLG
jgi:hypothetical protein